MVGSNAAFIHVTLASLNLGFIFAPSRRTDPLRMTIKQTAYLDTSSPTVKQILNRIFRDAQGATGSVQIGRHYFNHQEPIKVEKYSIDIWPGFSTRIDQYDGGIMVTMDAISKVMKNKNVLELMLDWSRVSSFMIFESDHVIL